MSDEKSPAPERTAGLECLDCTGLTVYQSAKDGDECEHCGSEATMVVELENCPAADPENCTHDDHHFGIGKHVIEIER